MRKFCGATIDKVGDRSVSKGAEVSSVPLATLTGRFQFDADDDNRTIIPGSTSFGTNYYIWSSEVFDTVSNGTVDTTTQSISNTYGGLSFKVDTASKVRCNFNHKPVNSSGYSKNYRAQIWSTSALGTGFGAVNWTLRADTTFTSAGNTGSWTAESLTTTSEIPAGHFVIVTVGLDNEDITAITYLAFQGVLHLVD